MPPVGGYSESGGSDDSVAAATDVGPAAGVSGLDQGEVAVLRQVGEQWERAVAGRSEWLRDLPVDPGLHRFSRSLQPVGAGRRRRGPR